jgi:hypothetical protein
MDLETLGHAAATYQRDPREIAAGVLVVQAERAAAEGAILPREAQPAMRLNDLAYYDRADIVAGVQWLVSRDVEKQGKVRA